MQPQTALSSNAWPFQEAERIRQRYQMRAPAKGQILFETGYGPSGLPHIGTFGEVARTSMVRRALAELCDWPSKLIAFSDDMDGLRKVPDNVPNRDDLAGFIGMPLTSVPDPFGSHESFGHHNNARLRAFLDHFGFDYEFLSSTECYRSGRFDAALLHMLSRYDEVMAIMLPSLRAERQATYSPFLPICPRTGRVLQVKVIAHDAKSGTITYEEDGGRTEVPVTGGKCKLQWKADWAMRWLALGVDYEMSGKDLTDSVKLSGRIARALGAQPPEGFTYELFLDEKGEKISKSRGNGLGIEEWLTYGPAESLSLFMYQRPKQAKRLYFDVIPRATDEYLSLLDKFPGQTEPERHANPVWHIHGGQPPPRGSVLNFSMLLNLASVCNTDDANVLWGFIARYAPGATASNEPLLAALARHAALYYRDFVKPAKRYRPPSALERAALEDLARWLDGFVATADPGHDGETIQTEIYEIGKRHGFENLRDWFKALYEVLLGQSEGPRMGSFIALYGVGPARTLVARALAGEDLSAA
jgi:lysyl-tRNA synthetase class 1